MNKLIILSGVPGSGKSYFSSTLKKIKPSHLYIVSSDKLRKEICGVQSDLSQEDLVWTLFYALANTFALDPDGVVVLDATHITTKLRVDKNKELAKKFSNVYLVIWELDKDIVNNQNLQRDYPIPPDAMDVFFANFEKPNEIDRAFFDKIIEVKDDNISEAIKALEL